MTLTVPLFLKSQTLHDLGHLQVSHLPNMQQKNHIDKKLDKVLKTLQAQEPDVEAITQKLHSWSTWVRYCRGNPQYVFHEYRQVCSWMLKTVLSLYSRSPSNPWQELAVHSFSRRREFSLSHTTHNQHCQGLGQRRETGSRECSRRSQELIRCSQELSRHQKELSNNSPGLMECSLLLTDRTCEKWRSTALEILNLVNMQYLLKPSNIGKVTECLLVCEI